MGLPATGAAVEGDAAVLGAAGTRAAAALLRCLRLHWQRRRRWRVRVRQAVVPRQNVFSGPVPPYEAAAAGNDGGGSYRSDVREDPAAVGGVLDWCRRRWDQRGEARGRWD
jgi:hypothetical protein